MKPKHSEPRTYVQPYRYPSPNIPLTAIRRFAHRIAERFQPQKIILFGSYAYGTPHNESDVDLLVIMPTRDTVHQALRIRRAFNRVFSLDLIVRTPKQIERGLRENDWFLRDIVKRGKVLYEARDDEVGSQGGRRLARRKRTRLPNSSPSRSGLLPLPTSSGEIPQGFATKQRNDGSQNARPRRTPRSATSA